MLRSLRSFTFFIKERGVETRKSSYRDREKSRNLVIFIPQSVLVIATANTHLNTVAILVTPGFELPSRSQPILLRQRRHQQCSGQFLHGGAAPVPSTTSTSCPHGSLKAVTVLNRCTGRLVRGGRGPVPALPRLGPGGEVLPHDRGPGQDVSEEGGPLSRHTLNPFPGQNIHGVRSS